jgi:hypothetical protein
MADFHPVHIDSQITQPLGCDKVQETMAVSVANKSRFHCCPIPFHDRNLAKKLRFQRRLYRFRGRKLNQLTSQRDTEEITFLVETKEESFKILIDKIELR